MKVSNINQQVELDPIFFHYEKIKSWKFGQAMLGNISERQESFRFFFFISSIKFQISINIILQIYRYLLPLFIATFIGKNSVNNVINFEHP